MRGWRCPLRRGGAWPDTGLAQGLRRSGRSCRWEPSLRTLRVAESAVAHFWSAAVRRNCSVLRTGIAHGGWMRPQPPHEPAADKQPSTPPGSRPSGPDDLDEPTPGSLTDFEILALARSCGDGTAHDARVRRTAVIALGLAGPGPSCDPALGDSVIAQARTWCVVQIRERAERARLGANPDPIDGPVRYRPSAASRTRLDRETPSGDVAELVCGFMCQAPDGSLRPCLREHGHPHVGQGGCSSAPRIWTPRDDGSCAVCGEPARRHIEIPGQVGACPAVAP